MQVSIALCLAAAVHCSTIAPSEAEQADLRLRAKAWSMLLTIQDASIRDVEWRDQVTAHFAKGGEFDFFRHESRLDEMGNTRVVGTQNLIIDSSKNDIMKHEIEVSVIDSVAKWFRRENDSVVVTCDDRAVMDSAVTPGLLQGLGRTLEATQIERRGEMLAGCDDLAIVSENPESVTLSGTVRRDKRTYPHRVSIDARTSNVQRHEIINTTWGFPFAVWEMREWQSVDGLTLPRETEYRVNNARISDEQKSEIDTSLAQLDLTRDAMAHGHPRFGDWVKIRARVFASTGGVPPAQGYDWQSAITTVVSVNQKRPKDWCEIKRVTKPVLIMNGAVECRSTEVDIDPKYAIPGVEKSE